MRKRECAQCGSPIGSYQAKARFCSGACRARSHRRQQNTPIPKTLRELNRWVRHDAAKRPLVARGSGCASSTDPATWSAYKAAAESDHGTGLGFVLNGDGISCVDLDHVITDGVLDPRAEVLLAELESFYVEVSPSGAGVHAWVYGDSPAGRPVYTRADGLKVEWYSTGRYMTVTGNKL